MVMKRKIKPCGDRVLVRLKKTETVSAGGIVLDIGDIAEAKKYATQEAYVVALGPDAYRGLGSGELWCNVGDLVLIVKYSGENRSDLEDGEVYRLISDEDVIAIFEGEELK